MDPLPDTILRSQLRQEYPAAESTAIDAAILRSGGYLGQAKHLLDESSDAAPQLQDLVKSIAAKDTLSLLKTLVSMERWKRDQLLPVLIRLEELLQSALLCRSGMPVPSASARELSSAKSSAELLKEIRHLQKSIEYVQGNVSVAAVCGYLEWALRE